LTKRPQRRGAGQTRSFKGNCGDGLFRAIEKNQPGRGKKKKKLGGSRSFIKSQGRGKNRITP